MSGTNSIIGLGPLELSCRRRRWDPMREDAAVLNSENAFREADRLDFRDVGTESVDLEAEYTSSGRVEGGSSFWLYITRTSGPILMSFSTVLELADLLT